MEMRSRIALTLLSLIFSIGCHAQYSGETNDGMKWSLSEDGVLVISECGRIPSYPPNRLVQAPWAEYKENVKELRIANGVRFIGEFAFSGCVNLTRITFGKDVAKIGRWAFMDCMKIQTVCSYSRLVPKTDRCAFEDGVVDNISLTVPYGRNKAYKADKVWSHTVSIQGIARGSIRDYIDKELVE